MPANVVKNAKEEKIWSYKKKQVEQQTGKKSSKFTDVEWRRVNFLFQRAKKKYQGRKLPKKYTTASSSFIAVVADSYQIVEALKPLEHFKNSGLEPFWSIQTERTHGEKGIIKVSKSKLEDPSMSLKPRADYQRMAGAEDIFQGSKESLMQYVKDTYKGFKAINFINA